MICETSMFAEEIFDFFDLGNYLPTHLEEVFRIKHRLVYMQNVFYRLGMILRRSLKKYIFKYFLC